MKIPKIRESFQGYTSTSQDSLNLFQAKEETLFFPEIVMVQLIKSL
jgi:hypothetical protein